MSEQRVLSIDSQILNSIQACARKTQYQFIELVHPAEKAEALEKGDLLHKMLDLYYSARLDNFDFNSWCSQKETTPDQIDPELRLPNLKDHTELVKAVQYYGRISAVKMNLDPKYTEEVIYQVGEYCKHYEHDGTHTLAVEEVGTKVLLDTPELLVIYNGKIDWIFEHGKEKMPADHKSSSKRTWGPGTKSAQAPDYTSLSNQFIGYPWLLGMNSIMVNKIGFQTSLKPSERFQREILTYSEDRIAEWVSNAQYWAGYLDWCNQTGKYPMNWTSCDKYSGCIYAGICKSNPNLRDRIILKDFVRGETWDVGEKLVEETK